MVSKFLHQQISPWCVMSGAHHMADEHHWIIRIVERPMKKQWFIVWDMVDFGSHKWVRYNEYMTCIWTRRASPCLWQCQKNNLIYALKYKSQSYTTDVTIMVSSMWGWIQWWSGTLDPWNSHGMLYIHDWWSGRSGMVHSCVDSLIESQNLCGTSMLHQS